MPHLAGSGDLLANGEISVPPVSRSQIETSDHLCVGSRQVLAFSETVLRIVHPVPLIFIYRGYLF